MKPKTAREIEIRNEAFDNGSRQAYESSADYIKSIISEVSSNRNLSRSAGSGYDVISLLKTIESELRK